MTDNFSSWHDVCKWEDDESWRGEEHLENWPIDNTGPEYQMYASKDSAYWVMKKENK